MTSVKYNMNHLEGTESFNLSNTMTFPGFSAKYCSVSIACERCAECSVFHGLALWSYFWGAQSTQPEGHWNQRGQSAEVEFRDRLRDIRCTGARASFVQVVCERRRCLNFALAIDMPNTHFSDAVVDV